MRTRLRARSPRRTVAVLLSGAVAAAVVACGGDGGGPALTVAHDGTLEMRVAAAVYGGALARTGVRVTTHDAPDGESALLDGVASGEVGLFPAFTGDLLQRLTPNPSAITSDDVLAEVNRSLPQQVSVGDKSLVSDRWQVLAGQDLTASASVENLADCGRLPAGLPLVVSGDPSPAVLAAAAPCQHGPVEKVRGAREVFDRVRDGRALGLIAALDAASVTDVPDVGSLKSDGAPIAQDLVPVFRSPLLEKPQLKALSRVAGELTTTDLAQMMREVRDGADPGAVAGRWLATHGV